MFDPGAIPIPEHAAAAASSTDMPLSVSNILIVYGPLGIMALVAMLFALKVYRDMAIQRTEHKAAMAAKDAECKEERDTLNAELRKLEERFVTKAETMLTKNHEIMIATNAMVESITRSRPRGT